MKLSNRNLNNPVYRKVLDAAPSYINTLIGTEWLRCEVHEEGPALAWTTYDEGANHFVVNFLEIAAGMSKEALSTLWRHEVGHVALGHFQQPLCNDNDSVADIMRATTERMVVADIHINYYLPEDIMREIGETALSTVPKALRDSAEPKGYIDPKEWLPKIGLNVDEYPYEIIHAGVHQFVDEQQQSGSGNVAGNGGHDHSNGMCGGIEPVDDASGMAEASAAVVAGVASEGGEDGISESWGNGSGLDTIRLVQSDLPEWITALMNFARSIVEVVLAEKRSHARPQEAYKAYGVHMPTVRPRWDYAPAQVCFLVDTSGSMVHELKYVGPTIDYLAQHNVATRLIAGDTRVTFDEIVTSVPAGLVGGGGTEISPLFERAEDYSPESIVCFSDGYVPGWPKEPGVPVLWVGCQATPPFGVKA